MSALVQCRLMPQQQSAARMLRGEGVEPTGGLHRIRRIFCRPSPLCTSGRPRPMQDAHPTALASVHKREGGLTWQNWRRICQGRRRRRPASVVEKTRSGRHSNNNSRGGADAERAGRAGNTTYVASTQKEQYRSMSVWFLAGMRSSRFRCLARPQRADLPSLNEAPSLLSRSLGAFGRRESAPVVASVLEAHRAARSFAASGRPRRSSSRDSSPRT